MLCDVNCVTTFYLQVFDVTANAIGAIGGQNVLTHAIAKIILLVT